MKSYRLDFIHQLLKKEKLTHVLITDIITVNYICGFKSSNVYLILSDKKNYLFTDFRYEENAKNFCAKNREWVFVPIKPDLSFLSTYLPAKSVVGIQSDYMTISYLSLLKKHVKKVTFTPLPDTFAADITSVKLDSEIKYMAQAAEIGDMAYTAVLKKLKLGMTEIEAAIQLERFCQDFGSSKPSFDSIVLFGKNSSLPHGVPSKTKLCANDFVLMDFGCSVNGFASDMTRTCVFGKANAKQKEIYSIVLEAQIAAKECVKPGLTGECVDAKARDIINAHGYGETFGHGTGHGIGLRVHESPRVRMKSPDILQPNMIFSVEPGIYLPGVGGVRIEDMVRVTKKGHEILTNSPRDLLELKVRK